MLLVSAIFGWLGILLLVVLAVTFPKLAKNEEFGFIHILMALMYAMWLPLPLAINNVLSGDLLQIGATFAIVYLVMMIVTMTLQTGQIVYATKNKLDQSSEHIMAMLSGPFELLANVFKSIWAGFLAAVFWMAGSYVMAGLMIIFTVLGIYFLAMLVDRSLIKETRIGMVKGNPYLFNLETLGFFLVLTTYITINL